MTTKVLGQLEIDHNRGVIYFHDNRGITLLRICRLPKPIPDAGLDITHMFGTSWDKQSLQAQEVGENVKER